MESEAWVGLLAIALTTLGVLIANLVKLGKMAGQYQQKQSDHAEFHQTHFATTKNHGQTLSIHDTKLAVHDTLLKREQD